MVYDFNLVSGENPQGEQGLVIVTMPSNPALLSDFHEKNMVHQHEEEVGAEGWGIVTYEEGTFHTCCGKRRPDLGSCDKWLLGQGLYFDARGQCVMREFVPLPAALLKQLKNEYDQQWWRWFMWPFSLTHFLAGSVLIALMSSVMVFHIGPGFHIFGGRNRGGFANFFRVDRQTGVVALLVLALLVLFGLYKASTYLHHWLLVRIEKYLIKIERSIIEVGGADRDEPAQGHTAEARQDSVSPRAPPPVKSAQNETVQAAE